MISTMIVPLPITTLVAAVDAIREPSTVENSLILRLLNASRPGVPMFPLECLNWCCPKEEAENLPGSIAQEQLPEAVESFAGQWQCRHLSHGQF